MREERGAFTHDVVRQLSEDEVSKRDHLRSNGRACLAAASSATVAITLQLRKPEAGVPPRVGSDEQLG
jgi:hypothetical protein